MIFSKDQTLETKAWHSSEWRLEDGRDTWDWFVWQKGGQTAPHPATNKQSVSVIFCSLCILYIHERAKHVSTVLFFVIFTNFPSAHLWLKLVTFYLTIIAFRL